MTEVPQRPQRLLDRRRFVIGGAAAGVGGLAAAAFTATPALGAAPVANGSVTATNIRDFGATGDGATDDTTAIQRAIDDCRGRGGGLVYIPSGRYCITGITLYNAIDLLGENHNTAILQFTTTTGNAIELGPNAGFNHLANFQIYYPNKTTSGAAIHLIKTFTVDIDGVYISGGSADRINAFNGIVADECTATFVRNFNIYFCQNDGVQINGPTGNDFFLSTGVVNLGQADTGAAVRVNGFGNGAVNITDAEVLLGKHSILADGSNYMRFANTYFDSSAQGVHLRSGNLITFSGCWFSNRPGPGLTVGAARGVSIMGCHVTNCGSHGVLVTDGARYVTMHGTQVIGNNTTGTGGDGIRVDGKDIRDVSIIGCFCGNDEQVAILQTVGQDVGIRVTRKVRHANYIITNNILFDNRHADLVDHGVGRKHVENNLVDRGRHGGDGN